MFTIDYLDASDSGEKHVQSLVYCAQSSQGCGETSQEALRENFAC